MTYVVEIKGYDPVGAADVTYRYAMGAGLPLTDAAYVPGYLGKWQSVSQQIEVGAGGGVQLSGDRGEITLVNIPVDIDSAGPLDALPFISWSGRVTSLYYVPALVWADKTLVAFGKLEQPVADLNGMKMTFPIRDPRSILSAPLQNTKYLGNNSGGSGVEGEADLTGQPKPVLYGVVSNIPGVRVNAQKLIYQLSDKAGTVICARDGGNALTAGTARGSLASLQSNIPPAGDYDYYSGTEGLFVRLCTRPVFQVTFDAKDGSSEADRTHAQVWKRIRADRGPLLDSGTDATTIAAVDALATHEIGFWWASDATVEDAINAVLTSLSGFEVLGFDNVWRIYRLAPPAAETTVVDLRILRPGSAMATKDRSLISTTMARPTYAPDGSPAYRVNVQWGQNYTIMAEADFAGNTTDRLRDKFSKQWRVSTAINTAIWNPSGPSGPWPNAPELTIPTGYQPGTDGLTCPHADSEATRLVGIYSALRSQFSVSFIPEPTDQILTGACASLTHPQMGLGSGAQFRVLQSVFTVETQGATVNLVLGLQG